MISWHVRCDECGQAGIWLTHPEACMWVNSHTCPPEDPTQPERKETA